MALCVRFVETEALERRECPRCDDVLVKLF